MELAFRVLYNICKFTNLHIANLHIYNRNDILLTIFDPLYHYKTLSYRCFMHINITCHIQKTVISIPDYRKVTLVTMKGLQAILGLCFHGNQGILVAI